MNKVELVGNLTRDPELRQTSSGTSVARFTVAVTRRFKSADGTQQSDFISCVAWRQQAEFVHRYFAKGSKIGVVGSIRTSQYDDQNGQRRYVTEVECDEIEFVTSKAQNPAAAGGGGGYNSGGGGYNGGGYQRQSAPPAQPQPAASASPPPAQSSDSVFRDDIPNDDFEPLDDAELPF